MAILRSYRLINLTGLAYAQVGKVPALRRLSVDEVLLVFILGR